MRIIAGSPPGSLVLILGNGGVKPVKTYGPAIDGIDYYLWLYHADITVVDGSLLSLPTAQLLDQANGRAWGVVYSGRVLSDQDKERAAAAGLGITQLSDTILLEPQSPSASPRQQIDALLAWATPLQPGLLATRVLLDADFQSTGLGDNLLPPPSVATVPTHGLDLVGASETPETWALRSGTSLTPDGHEFVLRPGGVGASGSGGAASGVQPDVNVTLTSYRIKSGPTYVISFRCYDQALNGAERVYVSVHDAEGEWMDTYPYGDGYECPPDSDGEREAFAFEVPSTTTRVVVWLRATGSGRAEFDDVQLRPVN